MQQLTCANCGNQYTGQYCNQCGQKQAHRYSMGHVLHELLHVFTHADKGIFSFGWQVLSRPGIVALDMVQGRRKRYFNLFQYLVLIVGIGTFVLSKTHLMEQTVQSMNSMTGNKISGQMAQMQQQMVQLLQKYFNLLQFFLIPVYAIFSWLFLRRGHYNYAENIILNSVISAQVNTISIASTLLYSLLVYMCAYVVQLVLLSIGLFANVMLTR